MPARSPEDFEPLPNNDGIFAGSGDLATEVTEMADGDVVVDTSLAELDPDQVSTDEVVKKRLGPTFWIAAGWFALVAILALLAPVLPLDDPAKPSSCVRCSPSADHWFGTDTLGRDLFSRVIWGARVSLVVGFAAILLSLVIGGFVGLVAGYRRGRLEGVLMGAMDVLLAFPALLLALAIIAFMGRSLQNVVLAVGLVAIAPVSRLVRASTLVFSQREFVTASRAIGASNTRILAKEVLPNVMLPVLSFSIIGVAVAIVAEGGLAFLGLSVPPPTPTWGGMINDGRAALETEPYITLIPCAVLFLTVLSLNLAGDRVREYFDIKEGGL
jgi:peptide/nickel transport system permease protein